MYFKRLTCALFAITVLASVAYADTTSTVGSHPKDPYEKFNRVMFNINEFVDKAVLKPVATLYLKVVPKPLVKGFSNVYRNIDNVPTVFNDVLQANFYQATSDSWRLLINSTLGVGGLFDVAQKMGLEPNTEDFGLTLARWGYVDSNFLVLPLLGPGTVRDMIGFSINYYVSIYPYINSLGWRYGVYGFGIAVRRADYMRYETLLQQISLDKYAFTRDAYLQRRNYLIERNKQLSDPYVEKSKLVEDNAKEARYEEESHPFSDI